MPYLIALALAVALALPQGAAPVIVKAEINEARGLTDFDLDGSGSWKAVGQTLVLETAGSRAASSVVRPRSPFSRARRSPT